MTRKCIAFITMMDDEEGVPEMNNLNIGHRKLEKTGQVRLR